MKNPITRTKKVFFISNPPIGQNCELAVSLLVSSYYCGLSATSY